MRIKRLEIQGFKSFKDKTVIHFDQGITGIVGPNGCGKSNIVDAMFWVMGEQSYKHIRGTSSDDLIFNGSSKYSPLGMAEATLVMETGVQAAGEDAPAGASVQDIPIHLRAKEVSVTRRLYRTGEGEYFINGVPARLKDIHELFMDTGVGAKGYSVIEQGQIGKIVNSKPEERRLLIEEAAGIAKYKARKKESLRKMEATHANLSRLNDVVAEIERNLNSLERQAQKARKYKEYKDELLDKEMTWGRRKTQVIRQRLEALHKQKEGFEQELLGLRTELQIAENSIETDRVEQLTDQKLAEELQSRVQNLSDDLTHEKSALDLSRRRQDDLKAQLAALEGERSDLEASIQAESEKIALREQEADASNQSYQQLSAKAQTLDEEVRRIRQEAETARRALDAAKRELMQGISQSSELTSRAASLLSRMEAAQEQAERLSQQVSAHDEKLTHAREESEKAKITAEALRENREKLQTERREQAQAVQTQEQSVRTLEREREESSRGVTQLKSKLQSLEELAQAYEGFGDGPRAAIEWARTQAGANGETQMTALADALDISEEYEAALEGWLEGRLENLVANEVNLALGAIDQIRESNQGRAAIHVSPGGAVDTYNSIRFDQIRAMLEQAGFEVVGELSQFAKIRPTLPATVREIAARATAHVCLVKSMKPLAEFVSSGASARLSHWSIASLDGNAFDNQGVLRGGSSEHDGAASVIRRKRAIADLEAQVTEAEAKHAEHERVAGDARQALELGRAKLQTIQTDLQSLEIQAAALERDVHQANRSVREAEEQLDESKLELADAQEAAQKAQLDRQAIEAQITEITERRAELETQVSEGDVQLAARDSEVRTQESELQSLRVEEASLRERTQSLKRELEAGRALVQDRQRRLSEIVRTLERASREQEQFMGGESSIEEKIQELSMTLAIDREKLSTVKDRLEQSSTQLNLTLERIKELHRAGDEKSNSVQSFALEIEKLSSDVNHLVQNLEEKYGPGCLERPVTSPIQEEMTDPVVTAEMSADEEQALGEEVERLRERIRRLGEVNVMAIEEYEELKKRYDHLVVEKRDLEKSIENLQEAIEHINKTSEDRFRRAFEAISDRFERLFPIIFGGGSAQLSLIYPENSTDILEAGVDILAQPPGKKVSNITLLSGGEKALTAVSLIFAIFMVKPSPFCLLDEVDAPLDDANIGKFNALLREMSAKSQFILITHNKKTMELNDTLYGVTMEEPGVSKMVSIQMN